MNIFVISDDWFECAKALDDLRLNKMILETAQLLSSACRYLFAETNELLYKDTHLNHPCAIWARKCVENYAWLYAYFEALAEEKHYRTGKDHLSYTKLSDILYKPIEDFDMEKAELFTEFDFDCTNVLSWPGCTIFDKYKKCLTQKWDNDIKPPKWTKRKRPIWSRSMKYFDELNTKQQEIVLDKLQDLPLFSMFREDARKLLTGSKDYMIDDKFKVHALSGDETVFQEAAT